MDFGQPVRTFENMLNSLFSALPTLLLACIVYMVFHLIARRIRVTVIYTTARRQKAKNLGLILGRLAQSAVVVAGALVALTVIFPSFQPRDLIQLLGIGSVAIGFAFHDLFQNFLAGILLLLTSPFKLGDQIQVDNFEGTVEDIQTRATTIKTYDERRIVIPNAELFTNSVTVNTAFNRRRMHCEIGIDYKEDIGQVKILLLQAINAIEGVIQEPAAEALLVALTDSGVTIRIYWWTKQTQQHYVLHLQDLVLTAICNCLMENHIEMPSPNPQHIFLTTMNNANTNGHKPLPEPLLPEE